MPARFELVSDFRPAGDQPQAIDKLVRGFGDGKACQTLLGATGTGKTFTAAQVIAALGKSDRTAGPCSARRPSPISRAARRAGQLLLAAGSQRAMISATYWFQYGVQQTSALPVPS